MRTKAISFIFIACLATTMLITEMAFARGGRGGGGMRAGGGFSGGGISRPSPAISRSPSMSRPAAPNISRQGVSRPAIGGAASRPAASRPATGTRPAAGGISTNRPSVGTGQGNRPTPSQLDSFLNLSRPVTERSGLSVGSRPAGANSAVADFLQGGNPGSSSNLAGNRADAIAGRTDARSGLRDSRGENRDFASDNRQGRLQNRGDQQAVRVANRGDMRSSLADGRGENRSERQQRRGEQADRIRDELENEFDDNHLFDDFWKDNPHAYYHFNQNPVFWTWATVGTFRTFFGPAFYGPAYTTGGTATTSTVSTEVYYEQGVVYSGEEQIPAQEYAEQAETIVTSAPEVENKDEMEWLPLGVFALAQAGNADVAPNMFLQLAVSKEGIIAGTYQNKSAEDTKSVEGMVDPKSQRAAWTIAGKTTPIMETKLASLTENETNLLVHFADGTTQEWLMLHIEKPEASK